MSYYFKVIGINKLLWLLIIYNLIIYSVASFKGGISALRFSKWKGVSWPTTRNILRKIRTARTDRDSMYQLHQLIEFDDSYVGRKKTGKRGRGASEKCRYRLLLKQKGKNWAYGCRSRRKSFEGSGPPIS